ncbi:MAG: hypothetical protein ACRCXC_03115 [Legionella sp.]
MSVKLNLVIHVQGGRYFPAVKQNHKADYAYVGRLAINAPQPVEMTKEEGETLSHILNVIAEDNNQLLASYGQWRKTIMSMVDAGELTREQLVQLYITFLPEQSHDTVSLSALEQSKGNPVIATAPKKREQQMIELLAGALSEWISKNQVEPDGLFDQAEGQATLALR